MSPTTAQIRMKPYGEVARRNITTIWEIISHEVILWETVLGPFGGCPKKKSHLRRV